MSKGKKSSKKETAGFSVSNLFKTKASKVPLKHQDRSEATLEGGVHWKELSYLFGLVAGVVIVTYLLSVFGKAVFNDYYTLRAIQIQKQSATAGWIEQFLANPLSSQWLQTSFAWDYQLAGANLAWNHIVNICLHLMACLYLFALVFRLSWRFRNEHRLTVNPYFVATASAAVLACHPLAVEGVAYISGRAGPLLAANYFLSLNCFLACYLSSNAGDRFWWFLSAMFFATIGIAVAPDAISLPIAMLSVAVLAKRPGTGWLDWATERPLLHATLFGLIGGIPYLLSYAKPSFTGNGFGLALLEPTAYWATQIKAIPYYYLRCFVLPVGLSVDPPVPPATAFADPWTIFGIAILIASLVSIYLLRKKPIACLGIIIFILGFFPSAIMVQQEVISDRRFYISLAGLSILVGWILARYANRSMKKGIIAGSVVLIVLSGLSIWHSLSFSSDAALWAASVRTNDASPRSYAMLSLTQILNGNSKDALLNAKSAVAKGQNSVWAFIATARALMAEKQFDQAAETFETALGLAQKQKLSPEIIAICEGGIAGASYGAGDYSKAAAVGARALSLDPYKGDIRIIVGRALIKMGDYQQGIMELRRGLNQNPGNRTAWRDLAVAGLKVGAGPLAYEAAKRGLTPGKPSIQEQLILAQGCILTRRYDEARKILDAVLATDKNNKEAQTLLAMIRELTESSDSKNGKDRPEAEQPESKLK